MNQSYARVNAPYATRKVFGVQLYKNNARALLSRTVILPSSDWLQHMCVVYTECMNTIEGHPSVIILTQKQFT